MRTLVISSRPSRSATALARGLGIRKLATEGRRLPRPIRLINWGCGGTRFMERYGDRLGRTRESNPFLNNPTNVATATNKLLTFQALAEHEDIPIPEFTTSSEEATAWNCDVVARQLLTGHSGEGIEIYTAGNGVAPAPLYVKYMKKKHEYRVHVILDSEYSHLVDPAIDVQQKRKRQETPNEEVDYQVRNHANGWVYCREELVIPEGLQDMAVRTVRALGLDFGAVDIIWNQHNNQLTVLEVNTAPGLEGQTLDFYVDNLQGTL